MKVAKPVEQPLQRVQAAEQLLGKTLASLGTTTAIPQENSIAALALSERVLSELDQVSTTLNKAPIGFNPAPTLSQRASGLLTQAVEQVKAGQMLLDYHSQGVLMPTKSPLAGAPAEPESEGHDRANPRVKVVSGAESVALGDLLKRLESGGGAPAAPDATALLATKARSSLDKAQKLLRAVAVAESQA